MSAFDVSRETALSSSALWSAAAWLPHVQETVRACALDLSDAQHQQLATYMALLQRWNKTYNLTALRKPQDMLTHHLADCLVAVPVLTRHMDVVNLTAARVLDVGSGGGLPGIVLAIVFPNAWVTCVDTVGKKAAFIQQVALELALPRLSGAARLTSVHSRVEAMRDQFDVITSRAFASLADFTVWTAHLLSPQAMWMAMKGQAPDEVEAAALLPTACITQVESLQVPGLDAQRCIVWMKPSE